MDDHRGVRCSLVLPLAGGAGQALRCLQALSALPDDPAHDVVVVDDASSDLAPLLDMLDGDVHVVRQPRRLGDAAALRAALGRCGGEAVVLLRGAGEVEPDFLRRLLRPLEDPAVALATAGAEHPVAAPALAWRSGALREVPAVADELLPGALCAALAPAGRIEAVPDAVARPASARALGGRLTPGSAPELTVVIPTLDATSDRLRRCVAAVQRATDAPHEIVVVDNGAPPQGFTAPVNAGVRAARGRYVVICNDDVEVLPGWWAPLRRALDDGAAVAFPLTVDGVMREDLAAWCFAVSREAIERFGCAPGEFLHPELVVWYQDTDLLVRLRQAGVPPVLVREAQVRHGLSETVATTEPVLRAWIDQQIQRDKARFEALHGTAVAGAAR